MRIQDPGWIQFGSGMETVRIRNPGWKKVGSGIRDKHPGSATLHFCPPVSGGNGRKQVVRIRENSLVQEHAWSKETSVSDPDSMSPDPDPAL